MFLCDKINPKKFLYIFLENKYELCVSCELNIGSFLDQKRFVGSVGI